MPSGVNRGNVLGKIEQRRLRDALAVARRIALPALPKNWPPIPDSVAQDIAGIEPFLAAFRSDPLHHDNVRECALTAALATPRVREMYWRMRRNVFHWPEFRPLKANALRLLETVIDLAREEAFPWFVNVQAEHVMFLARFERKTFTDRLRELESLAITRPARRISVLPLRDPEGGRRIDNTLGLPEFPKQANNWRVRDDQPPEDIPQWVIRYRRGIPHNKRRAAWWINYDLLCETQRVLPCFEVNLQTLAKDYKQRNRWFGPGEHFESEAAFKRMEQSLAKGGPIPDFGLRAALWEGARFE